MQRFQQWLKMRTSFQLTPISGTVQNFIVEFSNDARALDKTRTDLATRLRNTFDDIFNRFHTTHEYDGQTDRQMTLASNA